MHKSIKKHQNTKNNDLKYTPGERKNTKTLDKTAHPQKNQKTHYAYMHKMKSPQNNPTAPTNPKHKNTKKQCL